MMNYSSSISKDELLCRVHSMVKAYRNYGHLEADIDPLGLNVPKKYVTNYFHLVDRFDFLITFRNRKYFAEDLLWS